MIHALTVGEEVARQFIPTRDTRSAGSATTPALSGASWAKFLRACAERLGASDVNDGVAAEAWGKVLQGMVLLPLLPLDSQEAQVHVHLFTERKLVVSSDEMPSTDGWGYPPSFSSRRTASYDE